MKMKFAILIALVMSLLSGCEKLDEEKKAQNLVNECKELKIGMTRSAVIEKMGGPINTAQFEREGKTKTTLYFSSPRLASTFTHCVIDEESGLLEEVICGEDYKLSKSPEVEEPGG